MGKTIHFVSLGCPKNRVDSEVMLGVAVNAGYTPVTDPAKAQVIVVNTCGFIDDAKQESISTILALAEYRRSGACRKLVMAGCLSQRYTTELAAELPEVDHLLGTSDMLELRGILEGSRERIQVGDPAHWLIAASDPRVRSTRGASCYIKLAEGCSRSCAFCVIPALRGRQRSRDPDDIVREVERFADSGVLEINLIAQDSLAYGRDLRPPVSLAPLVQRLADIPALAWVRVHYLYPEKLPELLVELMAQHPKVLPYVDMPLQHVSKAMLTRMRRPPGRLDFRRLLFDLRERIPDLTLRTAFIVGHPGETENEFLELVDFVRSVKFEHLGVFCYSDQEGTRSHSLSAKVPAAVAQKRARKLMSLQRGISRSKNRARLGQDLTILVEGESADDERLWVGRHAGQAPEIDGCVYLSGPSLRPGTLVRGRITQAAAYDLVAEVDEDCTRSPEPPIPPTRKRALPLLKG